MLKLDRYCMEEEEPPGLTDSATMKKASTDLLGVHGGGCDVNHIHLGVVSHLLGPQGLAGLLCLALDVLCHGDVLLHLPQLLQS